MTASERTVPPKDEKTDKASQKPAKELAKEYGGPKGAEPTRYGTWEKNGIEVDF